MTTSKNFHNLWEFARASRVLVALLIFGFTSIATFGALTAAQSPAQAASEQDCTSNSIIKCGVTSVDDFIKKYKANATGDLDDIYQLNSGQLAQLKTAVHGTVYKDGRVVVNGKVVGTGAKSMGRQFLPGSTAWKAPNGKTYYIRSTSISFAQNSLDALVVMDKDGKAAAALLTACGNPVAFTPVTPPKKTTTPPKKETPPTKVVTVVQEKEVVKEVPKEVVKEVVKEQPAPELPQTGAESFAGALGMGSVAGAGYYWRGSRKKLLSRFRRQR